MVSRELPYHLDEGVNWMAEGKDRFQNESEGADNNNAAEAVGTTGGAVAGAAAGSVFGPLGTVAGAVVGGMLGNKAGDVVDNSVENVDREE